MLVLVLVLLLSVVLLLNMLIAMMAKTFDRIAEDAATNYHFMFAQLVVSYRDGPCVPPPFSLLGVPYALVTSLKKACCCCRAGAVGCASSAPRECAGR